MLVSVIFGDEPEPGLVVNNLELVVGDVGKRKPELCVLFVPGFEVNEDPEEVLTVLVLSLDDVKVVNIAKLKFSEDGKYALFSDVGEDPRNTEAGLVWLELLDGDVLLGRV